MKRQSGHPHLHLVRGARHPGVEGPITRLGLWQDFRPLSKKHLVFLFLPKLILLGIILFFLMQR